MLGLKLCAAVAIDLSQSNNNDEKLHERFKISEVNEKNP